MTDELDIELDPDASLEAWGETPEFVLWPDGKDKTLALRLWCIEAATFDGISAKELPDLIVSLIRIAEDGALKTASVTTMERKKPNAV